MEASACIRPGTPQPRRRTPALCTVTSDRSGHWIFTADKLHDGIAEILRSDAFSSCKLDVTMRKLQDAPN